MTKKLIKDTLLVANVVEQRGHTKTSGALLAVVEAVKTHERGQPLLQISGNELTDENSQPIKF